MPSTVPSGGDVQFAAPGSPRSTLPRFVASFGEPLHTSLESSEITEEPEEAVDLEDDSASTDLSLRTRGGVDMLM